MALVDQFTKKELEELTQNSHSWTELLTALGYSSANGNNYKTVQKRLDEYNISIAHFKTLSAIKRNPENIFIKDSTANQTTLRRWYEKGNYSEYKCAICGLPPIWQNKPLTLTLDHINGNNTDDRLENLRWICPNCDRQLPTYSRGAKGLQEQNEVKSQNCCALCSSPISDTATYCPKCARTFVPRKVENRPNREELKKLIRDLPFTTIGKQYHVSDNAIRKWCIAENLPIHRAEIKSYSDEEWEQI